MIRQKFQIKKTEQNLIQKIILNFNKIDRYPNGFKILVSRKLEPNLIRAEIFWVSEYIQTRFIYLNLLIIFKFNIQKNIKNI